MISRSERSFPRLAFARNIPVRRLIARVRRRVEQRVGLSRTLSVPQANLRPRSEWPRPVFQPRHHDVARDATGWQFTFLGVSRRFGTEIDWRPEGEGIGQLWRMNLHYFEFLEALDAEAGLEAIRQWIVANPVDAPSSHEAAWNPYALSLRIVSWLQWLAQHKDAGSLSDLAMIARSLAHQAAYIARFPETDIGGNHLIKNVKALAWAGAVFGDGGADWADRAADLLLPEIAIQILSDGVHFERSPSYHCQVAADLIEIARVQPELSPRILPVAEKMVTAAQALTHPDGRIAQFNDAGLTMAYPAQALASALAASGGEPANAAGCTVLARAGLASLRSSGLSAYVKFGPPGPGTLPAHAHGDIGSLELSARGHRVIVDQGVYEYVPGERRRESRSAACHNLTAPRDREMADFFGSFRCGWMPDPLIREASCAKGGLAIDVAHDGFSNLRTRAVVRRKIMATEQSVDITDVLECEPAALLPGKGWATRFLLHPDWQALKGPGRLELHGPNGIVVTAECELPATLAAAEWWPDMGVSRPTTRVIFPWERDRRSLEIAIRLM